MKQFIFTFSLIIACANLSFAFPRDSYNKMRKEILEYEKQLTFGGNLTLNALEKGANAVLMEVKKKEMQAAFNDPSIYTLSRNFLETKDDIEKSEVFKMIRRIPKGAVLHAHDIAVVSNDYVYWNITFRDNLYVCEIDGVPHLKFFDQPDKQCKWELLKAMRKDPARAAYINHKILKHLTMIVNDPSAVYTDINKTWDKFMSIFAFLNSLVTFRPVFEDFIYRALEELYEDNVMYMELRTTLPPLYELDGTVHDSEKITEIYLTVAERFKKDHPDFVGMKLIYAPVRSVDRKQVAEYIKTMKNLKAKYPNFITGFDLVGQEDKGNTLKYFSDMLLEVDPSINFFFHAGETNWYGASTDENLIDAVLLNTRRIGHGYALVNHPFILELVKRKNIAIEVNPISNQVLSLVGDLRNHAARRLFSEESPVVISNDDPAFWAARGLSYDFYAAFMALMSEHSDLRSLKQLAKNSLIYSNMNDAEKKHALALWESKWNDFVSSLAKKKY